MRQILFSAALVLATVGCKGTAKDPKTLSKDDLNPPYQLVSVTEDSKMTLQWRISNTEEDVVGYNVYVAQKSLSELQALLKDASVSKYQIGSQAIRRCEHTKDLFAVFGFEATDKQAQKSCDDFEVEAEETKLTALTLAEEAELTSKYVKCTYGGADLGAPGLSVAIANAVNPSGEKIPSDPVKRVDSNLKCEIPATETLSDGTKLENGKHYTAFVVAVKGEKKNEISYTSNFVEDIPTKYTTISKKSDGTTAATIVPGKYLEVGIPKDTAGAPTGAVELIDEPTDCPTATITRSDGSTFTKPCGQITTVFNAQEWTLCERDDFSCFFLVEDPQGDASNSTTGKERVFLVPKYNEMFLAKRDPSMTIQRPGDVALKFLSPVIDVAGTNGIKSDTNGQYRTGQAFALYPGALIDFAIKGTTADTFYYGKLYVEELGTNADAATGLGTKTFTLKVAFQKALNEVFYLTE